MIRTLRSELKKQSPVLRKCCEMRNRSRAGRRLSKLPDSQLLNFKVSKITFRQPHADPRRHDPASSRGRDVIGTAETETGKPLAFLILLIAILHQRPAGHSVALVLLPMAGTCDAGTRAIGAIARESCAQGSADHRRRRLRRRKSKRQHPWYELVIASPAHLQDLVSSRFAEQHREYSQDRRHGPRLDVGGRSRGVGTAPDRTHSQNKDRVSADRQDECGSVGADDSNTPVSRTLTAFSGRDNYVER